jgi:hypothetical protein
MKIPPGMLKEIKQLKEKDIRETYASSESALAHQDHLRELQEIIFKKFDIPYSVVIYGDPSPELLENAKAGGMDVKIFTLLQGL